MINKGSKTKCKVASGGLEGQVGSGWLIKGARESGKVVRRGSEGQLLMDYVSKRAIVGPASIQGAGGSG